MRFAATHRTNGQRLLAVFAAISMILSLMAIFATPAGADGEDSSAECTALDESVETGDVLTYTVNAPEGYVIDAVCIKSGDSAFASGDSKHSALITSDGPVSGSAFSVSGLGTASVTVTSSDKTISHIDYRLVEAPEPEVDVNLTSVCYAPEPGEYLVFLGSAHGFTEVTVENANTAIFRVADGQLVEFDVTLGGPELQSRIDVAGDQVLFFVAKASPGTTKIEGSFGEVTKAQNNQACEAVEEEPETRTLQIKKEATDDTELEFTFTGPEGNFTLKHGESFFFEAELGVEYTFTEILPEGWRLEDIECNENGTAVIDLENNSVTMVVTELGGSPFKCHFDNEEGVFDQVRTLQIKKHATDDRELEFTFTGPDGEFTLSDNESFFFEAELGVEYTFTEILPEGWFLEDIECNENGTAVIDLENNSVTMVVTELGGSPFKCDFDNEESAAPEIEVGRPEIAVDKSADAEQANVGETVTFTVVISNPSATESVKISSIVDSLYGVLDGDADCKVDVVLAAGASCEFTFTAAMTANDIPLHTNVVTVIGADVEQPEITVSASDNAKLEVAEVAGIIITPETPAGPVTQLTPQVEAEQLPFTGLDSDRLLGLAIMLLGGGVLLLRWAPPREIDIIIED